MNELLLTGLLIFLLILDWLCLASKVAFQQTSQARLLAFRETDEKRSSRALNLFANLTRLSASLNLALILLHLCLAATLFVFIKISFPDVVIGLVFLVLLFGALLLFWFECLVELVILKRPENWALRLAVPARIIQFIFGWALALPLRISGKPARPADTSSIVTENDLKTLVDVGQEDGVFEQGERRMIYSIFQLSETLVREIMIPRLDMFALEVDTPLKEAVELILKSGHSRVPVYRESVDQTLGVLYVKDLLSATYEAKPDTSLHNLFRQPYFVPEAKHVDELLAEMQSQHIHMAIVVDEYGGVAGLVTMEDIMEEIVGEIKDEYDQGEESPYQIINEEEYLFQARIDLNDFNEVMGCSFSKEEADSLGGFIYSRLGHVPVVGETVQEGSIILTVEQVSARRIRKVRARKLQPSGPEETHPGEEGEGLSNGHNN
jgi:putative hemolysin